MASSSSNPSATGPGLSSPVSPTTHLRYDLSIDTSAGTDATSGTQTAQSQVPQSASQQSARPQTASGPQPPGVRRRSTRAGTFRNVDDYSDYEHFRPGWQPGAEPGIDTTKPDGGHDTLASMKAPSEITVVDFSQSHMNTWRLNNQTLSGFLAQPRSEKTKCRWINVNGLSWDVIQILGNHKALHRLAIEDLMNTRNRTKADWYPTHTYMVLTLQKLVQVRSSDLDSNDSDDDDSGKSTDSRSSWKQVPNVLKSLLRRSSTSYEVNSTFRSAGLPADRLESGNKVDGEQEVGDAPAIVLSQLARMNRFRTLQQYHSSPNDLRTDFMESHSALTSRNLSVAAEQVSIFITSDNTVISFFELSAQDVEQPILVRLSMADTSLRRSCDASLVAQAILDAIIDLAIPVAACYGDIIADLELDVLTRPSVNHTKMLYITITEMNKVLSFINPVMNLINTLRDHKSEIVEMEDLLNPEKGVIISPTTYIYLADVLDHCVLITDNLEQTKGQAENMISLIFNTISAYQNESMKQLTIVTFIFLPLTFLTGYFGQNFDNFGDLARGIPFFWKIAAPVIFFTILISSMDYIKSFSQQRHIFRIRRDRRHKKRA